MSETPSEAMLQRLEAFIGEWSVEASFPNMDTQGMRGLSTFQWSLNRQFLVQRSQAPSPAPESMSVVGLSDDGDGYLQHYFDSRGVARLYVMRFDGIEWTLLRNRPDFTPLDFSQRFIGTFADGGTTIRGQWEKSTDGLAWERDFGLTFTKVETAG